MFARRAVRGSRRLAAAVVAAHSPWVASWGASQVKSFGIILF
jgi:hypothetical protein